MTTRKSNRLARNGRTIKRQRGPSRQLETACVCLFAGLGVARAQTVINPPAATQPQYTVTPPAMQEYQTNNPMQVFAPETGAGMGEERQPLTWNFITAHPHVYYNFLYGTGISTAPGQQQDSIVQTVSPGVLFNLGDHWTLDYTPTLTYYSSKDLQDTLAESVQLTGGTTYEDWVLGLSQGYTSTSSTLVQTAAQTSQDTYSTGLSAIYEINSELSLSLGANQVLNYVENNFGTNAVAVGTPVATRTWSTMDWLNYEFWPRLVVGLGAGYGYVNQEGGSDMMYEQYAGQANWRATDKVSFMITAGAMEYQFLGSDSSSDLLTPTFSAAVQYLPFEHTRVTLSAGRTTSTSYYFVNEVTETSQVAVDLNQRLFGKLYLDVGAGYTTDKYDETETISTLKLSQGTSRSDDYYNFNISLSYPFLKRGNISVFYNYSKNNSNQAGFLAVGSGSITGSSAYNFTSNQVGFSLSYSY